MIVIFERVKKILFSTIRKSEILFNKKLVKIMFSLLSFFFSVFSPIGILGETHWNY
jgi:hypothetical protein